MTLSIQPDGPLFLIAVTSHAGTHVAGPRLWKGGFLRLPLPPDQTTGLTHEQAIETLAKWNEFLDKQSKLSKQRRTKQTHENPHQPSPPLPVHRAGRE